MSANRPPKARPYTTAAVISPALRWTSRETSWGIGASCLAFAWASSNPMAWLTAGSPTTSANPVATSPPRAPATSPQMSRFRSTAARRLVAGEAEQVAPVVDPLVHGAAGDERRHALVDTHEVDEQHQRGAEQRPWERVADRDRRRVDDVRQCGRCGARHVRHGMTSPGLRVLSAGVAMARVPGSRGRQIPVTVARPRRLRTGFLAPSLLEGRIQSDAAVPRRPRHVVHR